MRRQVSRREPDVRPLLKQTGIAPDTLPALRDALERRGTAARIDLIAEFRGALTYAPPAARALK